MRFAAVVTLPGDANLPHVPSYLQHFFQTHTWNLIPDTTGPQLQSHTWKWNTLHLKTLQNFTKRSKCADSHQICRSYPIPHCAEAAGLIDWNGLLKLALMTLAGSPLLISWGPPRGWNMFYTSGQCILIWVWAGKSAIENSAVHGMLMVLQNCCFLWPGDAKLWLARSKFHVTCQHQA